jgi:tetratricopeptide (TPR) repeat protein
MTSANDIVAFDPLPGGAPAAPAAASAGGEALPPPEHREVAQGVAYASRLRDGNDLKGAANLFARLREIEPNSLAVMFLGATLQERAGRLTDAEAGYGAVLVRAPRHVPSLVRRAACLAGLRRPLPALDLLERAAALDPASAPVRRALGRHLVSLRRYGQAAPHLEAAAAGEPTNAVTQVELADVLDRAGDTARAAATYKAALAISPVKAPVHVRLSTMALVRGDREAARARLADALAADPADGYAHLSLATQFPEAADEAAIRAALVTASDRPPPLYAAPLTFALARVLERAGQDADAFDAYARANAIMAPLQRPSGLARAVEARLALYTGAFVAARASWGARSDKPVFVTGLPRSGAALVEQIIASHPQAVGLGETEALPPLAAGLGAEPAREAVRAAAAAYLAAWPPETEGARRVVDKSLSTWMMLGPALLMFPHARFISVERHPLDNAWSIWTELFADNAQPEAYDMARIGAFARLHRQAMDGWREAFPGRILTLRHERLVADPEAETRRLLDHLALPFDAACLAPQDTRRTVRTASASQVRQPVTAAAVGRAARYGARLDPLRAALGDLIARYEAAP